MSIDDEILFQHPASYNEVPGQLSLIGRGLSWKRMDGASSITILWHGIVPNSDKYQPSKGLIRIQDIHSKEFKIFTLLEKNTDKLVMKFDLCKRYMKHKLYQEPCPISSSSKSSLVKIRHGFSEDENRKENILDSQPELRTWYEDLLHHGVCDSDSFWIFRSGFLRDVEISDKAYVRGIVNSLLSDVDQGEFDSKGVKHIQMNQDSKEETFVLYPAVKKDFDEKVPSLMTEDEFWGKYFQKLHSIQVNHETTQSIRNASDHTTSQMRKKQKMKSALRDESTLNLSPFVTIDVDLTVTTGDYHTPEVLDPEDYNWRTSNFISEKYVNKSTLVMQQEERQLGDSTSSRGKTVVGPYRLPLRKRVYPVEVDNDAFLLNNSCDESLIPLYFKRKSYEISSLSSSSEQSSKLDTPNHRCEKESSSASSLIDMMQHPIVTNDASSVFPASERALKLLVRSYNDSSEAVLNSHAPSTVKSQRVRENQDQNSVVDLPPHFDEVRLCSSSSFIAYMYCFIHCSFFHSAIKTDEQ